jgi:hypothetical protein
VATIRAVKSFIVQAPGDKIAVLAESLLGHIKLDLFYNKIKKYQEPEDVFSTIHFFLLTNGPNKLECYIALYCKRFPRAITLDYWALCDTVL